MDPEELWKSVVGYEGLYEVSSSGCVRRTGKNHGATRGRLLCQRLGRGGYPVVRLTAGAITKTCYVHRLVALAFLGPCPPRREINHKDSNKLNPLVTNLEYVSRSENIRHALRHRRSLRPEIVKTLSEG